MKIAVSFIAATLFGLLYAYENPDHKYYEYSNGKSREINYDAYQLRKKENQRFIEYGYSTPIRRSDTMNIWRVLIVGSLSFIGMMLIVNLFQSVEHYLKKNKSTYNNG